MRGLLLAVLVMAGCPAANETDGGPTPLDDNGLELRAFDRESEVAIGPNGETPWVRGFQGGTMIRPVLVLPSDGPHAVGDEVEVRLTHAPDPDAPAAFGIDEVFRVYERPSVVELRGDSLRRGADRYHRGRLPARSHPRVDGGRQLPRLSVTRLLGRPPTTLRELVEDHAALWARAGHAH